MPVLVLQWILLMVGKVDEDEGDDEENTQALKTNHPNDPGNRTKYNKKVEETIRKTIRNILKEIM